MVSSNPSKTSSSQVQRCLSAVLVLFFVLFCLGSSSAFAACHAVTPSGSGSKTGSDWNDAMRASRERSRGATSITLPTEITEATLSAKPTRELRRSSFARHRATTMAHRSPSIGAGWNASTMGSSQAVFASTGSALTISTDYFTMNGNGNSMASGCGGAPGSTVAAEPPTPSDCGFRLQGTGGTSSGATNVVSMGFSSSHQTFEYIELLASGTNSGDLEMFPAMATSP